MRLFYEQVEVTRNTFKLELFRMNCLSYSGVQPIICLHLSSNALLSFRIAAPCNSSPCPDILCRSFSVLLLQLHLPNTHHAPSPWHLWKCPTTSCSALCLCNSASKADNTNTFYLFSFFLRYSLITRHTWDFSPGVPSTLSPLIQTLCGSGLMGWMGHMVYIAGRKFSSCLLLRSS